MCRFFAYKGAPIILDQLLYQPKNSLIHQSYDAREIEEPLNGDGFGVGWYVPDLGIEPAVFVSVFPAWSNRNLRYLSPKIRSGCLFAHVRAASFGDISEANCHPFHHGRFLMMHNGSIEGFDRIKRVMRRRLKDETYSWVRGQTDSEHFFAVFLDHMLPLGANYGLAELAAAVEATVNDVEAIKRDLGIQDGTYLNTVVSDGRHVVATRFVSTDEEPLSLYVSEGNRYECKDGVAHMAEANPLEHAVLIVSEKLTERSGDWTKVPRNHLVLVGEDNRVAFRPIRIDQGHKLSA